MIRISFTLLCLIAFITNITTIPLLNNQKDLRVEDQSTEQRISSYQKYQSNKQNLRILQDNPFNPTGDTMKTTPGVRPNDNVLTIDIINQIAQQNGTSTKPNITTNTSGSLYTIDLNNTALNISLIGSTETLLGNRSWIQTTVDQQATNPAWIAASAYLFRTNISYIYPNQVILLLKQNNSLGNLFNATFRSVRGFVQAIVLIYSNFTGTLLSSQILTNIQTVPVNSSTLLYNVTRSLLQSLFYDFTLAPLTLQNGTESNYSGFTAYDLRYQSKNGIYGFVIKSQIYPNGSIVGWTLSCTPITISVATQTVPVLASINLINVDGDFKYVNQTISDFISKNLNKSNYSIIYNSVVLWSNRAGSSILYYLNLTVNQSTTTQSYFVGLSYNLTSRQKLLTYWRSASNISPFNPNSTEYQQVPYLQVVTNSTFTNVDLSARTNYPTIVAGPLVKVEIRRADNKTGYRLTYYGVDGRNVQAGYSP